MMEIRLANRHEAEVCYQCIENARAYCKLSKKDESIRPRRRVLFFYLSRIRKGGSA